jgi:hypothetical protein
MIGAPFRRDLWLASISAQTAFAAGRMPPDALTALGRSLGAHHSFVTCEGEPRRPTDRLLERTGLRI